MKRALLVALAALAACPARGPAPATTPPPPQVANDEAPPVREIDEALITSTAPLARPFHHLAVRGDQRVHLLGTVHLGIDPARLPASVWTALEGAPIFAMEADLGDSSALIGFLRDDGTTLDQELGPDYWAKLEAVLGRDVARGLKPLEAAVAAMMVSLRDMPETAPMDDSLRARAEARGARIAFFEEPAFQVALIERWMDARSLKAQLDDLDAGKTLQLELLTAYARGDESVLAAIAADETGYEASGLTPEELAQMNREMLLDRNLAWIPQIEALSAEGELFVAVGAAHLYGPGGVIALLEDRGWTVERVAP